MASVIFWSLVLIALLLGGYFAVMWLRRTLKEEDDTPSADRLHVIGPSPVASRGEDDG